MEQEYKLHLMKNQHIEALKIMEWGITQFPWEISVYERAISVNMQLGENARLANNFTAMNQYWEQVTNYSNRVAAMAKELQNLPEGQLQGREFGHTPTIRLVLGQIQYIRGDYPTASEIMQPGITDRMDLTPQQQMINQQLTRWYLASLRKQGKDDKVLYDKFVAQFTTEQTEINRLLNTTFVLK
jgi:hypothetical protein